MDAKEAVPFVEQAIQRESARGVRRTMETVLHHLKRDR
jgi:hypothetical protein